MSLDPISRDPERDAKIRLKFKRRKRPYMPKAKTVEWETPQPLFDRLNAEFHFDVDVCANADNAKCARYFTPEQNGLLQDWAPLTCWMNPPYGSVALRQWMGKAYQESLRGATVVCLVPSRTDTKWWHDYAQHGEYRFIKGRVRFVGAASGATFPSVIVIFRPPQKEMN